MPAGLTTKLRRDELVDLVAFLSQLGKEGQFRVPGKRLVRSWRVLDANSQVSALVRANGVGALAREPHKFPWREATSTVVGSLPLSDVPAADFFAGQRFRVVQFAVSTPRPGPAILQLNAAEAITGYAGADPVEVAPETTVELPSGRTVITLVLEEGRFPAEALTVELRDTPRSPARPELAPEF